MLQSPFAVRFLSNVPTWMPVNSPGPPALIHSVAAAAMLIFSGVQLAASALWSETAFLIISVPLRTVVGPV